MNLRSLRVLLPAAAMTAMLAVVGATSLIHYGILDRTISANTASSLVARQANLIDRIQTTFNELSGDVSVRAASGEPAKALQTLAALFEESGPDARQTIRASLTEAASDGSAYRAAYDGLMDYFKSAQAEHGYYDVFLISPKGDVLLTVAKESDLLGNVLEGELAGTGLARAYQAALKAPAGQTTFADYSDYPPSKDARAAFLAATVTDADGKPLGVYAVQLPDFALPAPPAGGDPIDVTVAGADNQLRLSLDTSGNQPLAIGANLPESAPLSAALRGESGVILDQTDQNGQPAAIAYAPIQLMDTVWGITTVVPRVSMLALLRDNILSVSVSMLLLLGVMGGISLIAARWVGQPLVRLAHTVAELAAGREPRPIPDATRRDEVGLIAREIDSFRLIQTQKTAEAMQNLYLGTAFQQAGVAMMILDEAGTLRFANAAMSDLLAKHATTMRKLWPDLDPDHLVGAPLPAALVPPMPQAGTRNAADIDFGGTAMSITASPIADASGRTLGLLLMWEDVVEQRKARAIVSAIQQNQVMVELDADARIISANHHACALYGYTAEEFVGLDLRRLMRDEGASLPRVMAELRQSGCVAERQRRRTKTDQDIWVDCTFNAIFDDQRRILRIVVVCVDVTEQVHRTEAVEAAAHAVQVAQGRVVDALGAALGRLASGDLTATLNDPFGPEYEALRGNYNAAVHKLHDALDGVVDGARNIRNGASEIAEAADDLSRRTESQAATLEETAAALDLLTENVKSAAAGADEADRTVAEARAQAETSGGVVIEAVSAMSEIEQSSRQIRQIIGVIDDIAFQTNLLALNAGVEAARAGDAGRGFAVVASEVRALAQRSSEAAKEIKELISASSRHVEKGVGLVGQTGEALKSIVEGVSAIATRVSAIAQSAREQSTGLSEINSGVSNMDQVTQQNAAMVEQSTAASHSLRTEAEQLASLVAHFNLRQRGSADRATPRAAAATQATAPQPAAVPQMPARAATRSRTAPAAAAATAPAGWEEF